MKPQRLFEIIGLIDESFIEEAQNKRSFKNVKRKTAARWLAVCATFAVIITAGIFGTDFLMNNLGGQSGNLGAGGSGHSDGSTVFMSYAGPVMPLSVSKNQGITAERNIKYDFSKQDNATYSKDIRIEDEYLLKNNTEKDISVTATYPFASSVRDICEYIPSITVDGIKSTAVLSAGKYNGFINNGGNLNSFSDYKALLADGKYKSDALNEYELLDMPVVVYEFSNYEAPLEKYPAATQNVEISVDFNKTRIMSYGFNGGGFYPEENKAYFNYFVPDVNEDKFLTKILIVIGDDIDYTLSGYKTGATEKGNELEGVSCTVTRYEANLSDVLHEVIKSDTDEYKRGISADETDWTAFVSDDMLLRVLTEIIRPYAVFDKSTADRYDFTRLDDMLLETYAKMRVIYLSFDILIPAGQSISVKADMIKSGSFDFYCSGSKNTGVRGYDMSTALDSNIVFKEQNALVVNYENIEIVSQNFGFDLNNKIDKVTLDSNIEHYYLEVKVKK